MTGVTWGGCLESVDATLAVGRWVHPVSAYDGCVLVLEASEETPSAEQCFRMLRNLGERGLLGAASALVWGRPPVTSREVVRSEAEIAEERAQRREAVLRAVAD